MRNITALSITDYFLYSLTMSITEILLTYLHQLIAMENLFSFSMSPNFFTPKLTPKTFISYDFY